MPRVPKEIKEKAYQMYKDGTKLIDISKELNIPAGTVRRWKSEQGWDNERSIKSERSERKANARKEKKERIAEEDIKSVIKNENLTDKQRLFCLYYVRCFNATRAYQKAYGCSYETAMANGSASLRNTKIQEEIHKLKQNRLNAEMMEESDIVQKYMDIAFADITDFVEFGREEVQVMGAFGPVEVKDPETGRSVPLKKTVNTVRFRESNEVDGTLIAEVKQGKDGASVKLMDRMKALEWLSNYFEINPADKHRRAFENRKLEIELLKLESQIKDTDAEEELKDNFMDAMNATAQEVWGDGSDDRAEDQQPPSENK